MKNKRFFKTLFSVVIILSSSSILTAQAQPSYDLNPRSNDLWNPYGLDGVPLKEEENEFLPRNFLHARWGRFQGVESSTSGKVTFSINSQDFEGGSIEDYFIVKAPLVEWDVKDKTLNLKDVWNPEAIGHGSATFREGTNIVEGVVISFDVSGSGDKYYLLKKLYFEPDALEFKYKPNYNDPTKLIILIHGWNPSKFTDAYAENKDKRELFDLSQAIQSELENKGWTLAHYRWERDSITGPKSKDGRLLDFEVAGHVNGQEAAEVGHMHGYYLGELLCGYRKLEKIHFIAHSAGSWVARSAVSYLSSKHANKDKLKKQVTLLDPFIPERLKPPDTSLSTDRMSKLSSIQNISLENYFSDSFDTDKFGGNESTAQKFEGQPNAWINKQTDKGKGTGGLPFGRKPEDYDDHSGPIRFYTDSITGKVFKDDLKSYGWKRSLFAREHQTPAIKPAPFGNLPQNQTIIQKEPLGDEFYQLPYARSSLSAGEYGGASVEFVQKARPELTYGWAEASNATTRARQGGYAVNSLPRVGAVFIDPARVGPYTGHVGIVTAVTQAQFNGQKYYRLLIDDSDAATYQKIRRDVLMWLRLEANGTVVFDPSIRRDGEKYRLYERGESSRSGPERPILFIHEKVEEYNRKRQELAKFYDLSGDDEVDQIMALRRNLVFYLVDRSGSMKGEGGMLDLRDEVRQRIFEHANNLPANTQVELQFFNSSAGAIKAWHPFKSQNLAQFKAYFEAKFNPDGGTRLFDTVYEAMEHLSGQGLAYNQIEFIIFSDGDDNASGAQAKGKRWEVISPALAQLQQVNHFVRTYLFTMGYELAKPDAQTLASMGVEITAVAVEENQKNLEKFDRIELKDGSRYHGKILAKELRFDTNFGSSLVKLSEILSYKSGKLTTRDKFSKAAELSGDDLKIDTAEGSISVPANLVIRVETGR